MFLKLIENFVLQKFDNKKRIILSFESNSNGIIVLPYYKTLKILIELTLKNI